MEPAAATAYRNAQRLRPSARKPSLRVVLVTEATSKGTGRHVLDLAEGLIARGCDVHLLYSPVRADTWFRHRMWRMPGLNHVSLAMQRSIHVKDISAAVALRRYLRQNGPFDIIHGHSSKGGAVARLASIGLGVPTLYTPHALILMAPDISAIKRGVYHLAELVLAQFSTGIITVSPEEARVAASARLGKSRLTMIPNGVGPMELPPRDEARRNCGMGAKEIIIGWVGRLVQNKAPDVMLEALAIAVRTAPRLRVVLIGDGPLKKSLEDLAVRLGVAENVAFMGEVDARRFLPAFDLFAISSRMEGMPYVALEAMAAGLPIVSTSTGGVELLVKEGDNGMIVPTDDREALAGALVALASDPEMIQRMGSASKERIGLFSMDRMIDRTLSLYQRCAIARENRNAQFAEDPEGQLAGDLE